MRMWLSKDATILQIGNTREVYYNRTFTFFMTFAIIGLEYVTPSYFYLILNVLHDVMGPYQLVAPNWRPLTLAPGSQLGQAVQAMERVQGPTHHSLDTQGYLMMPSSPTAANSSQQHHRHSNQKS